VPDATYEIVKTGRSGHAESLKSCRPATAHYRHLLFEFFRTHDPTTRNRQGTTSARISFGDLLPQ